MADAGRKDMTDKAKESAMPDSQKSTTQKVQEGVTDAGDKAARAVQPDQSKSASQGIADTVGGSKDNAKQGDSMLDQAKQAVGLDKK
jgi:hypothetical protein